MKIITEKKKYKDGDSLLRLELPYFIGEESEICGINDYYKRMLQTVMDSAKNGGYSLNCETYIRYSDGEMFSLYINFFKYKNAELFDCFRLSDNRSSGVIIRPANKIKRKIPKNGGWYFDGKNVYVYENSYKKGDEKELRRSEYSSLFKERMILQSFDIKAL